MIHRTLLISALLKATNHLIPTLLAHTSKFSTHIVLLKTESLVNIPGCSSSSSCLGQLAASNEICIPKFINGLCLVCCTMSCLQIWKVLCCLNIAQPLHANTKARYNSFKPHFKKNDIQYSHLYQF